MIFIVHYILYSFVYTILNLWEKKAFFFRAFFYNLMVTYFSIINDYYTTAIYLTNLTYLGIMLNA